MIVRNNDIMPIISTDEYPSLRIKSFPVINLRGVFVKLNLSNGLSLCDGR